MLEELNGKGILIHHWDSDGISSARIIMEKLKNKDIINVTPALGNYYLTDEEVQSYSKYDFVIIVDMSLTPENIEKLSKNSKVIIFDHHLGKIYENIFHHNPILKGEDPDKYPSASWIINNYLKNDVNLYALLGVIGDHEEKIKSNTEFWQIIQDFCRDNNTTFEDMHKMVYLLDSNYKIGDKKAVEQAPHILLNLNNPLDILNNQTWNKNLQNIDSEMEKILKTPGENINNLVFKKIDTQYNIISTITRKISWSTGKNTLVINTGFFNDKDQLYLRSKKNAEPLIKKGKELGFKCGGKKEVLGAIVPKDKTNMFIEEIMLFLENKTEE
jgi:single-stranded DNA-specific DHH superfamily exonuclease